LVGQLAELLVVPKLNNAECVLPVKKVDPLWNIQSLKEHQRLSFRSPQMLTFYMSIPISSVYGGTNKMILNINMFWSFTIYRIFWKSNSALVIFIYLYRSSYFINLS
jgi:hypothetical protein